MSEAKKLPVGLLIKAALALAVLGAVAVLLLRGVDVRGLANRGFEMIREAGPLAFFAAMAVLPAIGAPLSVFYLTAGSAFADQMTLPGVIAAALVALTINIALTYWLAHHGLRPAIEWVLKRTPYRIPKFKPEDELAATIVIRVTPGSPFFLQGYILALAGVRFRTYMIVSCAAQYLIGVGVIIFGKALMSGKGGMAFIGFAVLVVAIALVQVVRRRMAKKNGTTDASA